MSRALDLWLEEGKIFLQAVLSPIAQYSAFFSNFLSGLTVIGSIFLLFLIYSSIRYSKETARLLKKPQTLAISALMMAVNIVLGYYMLRLTPTLRIGFGFLTQSIVGFLFGPLVACMTGMIQDVLCYLLNPEGGLLPAYTLSVGIAGMIYGLLLYRKSITWIRVFYLAFLIIFVVNIVLNSIALAPVAGSGFVGILPGRIVKNIVMLPIQGVLTYFVLKLVKKIRS
ncbi:MAG: folate family ECF transporter S component [Clostridia bacterium]|nr:folate family ECF transporter S component [Clostridia bacterium]